MNIAYLTGTEFTLEKTGGSVHSTQLARGLLSRGHKLFTNLPDESGSFHKFTKKNLFSLRKTIDSFYIRIHGSASNDRLTFFRILNPAAPCIWEINAPLEEMVLRGKSDQKLRKYNLRRINTALRLVDGAICVSHEMELYAQKKLGIQNTCVIENGSDPQHFSFQTACRSAKDPRKKFTVLWIGSNRDKWQAQDLVIKLARRFEQIDNEILFILTTKGRSEKNIRFLGNVPYRDIPRFIHLADIGLCVYEPITFYDNFYFSPLKLFDYMAGGLPIIGNNLGQIRSVITKYQCGLLTDGSVDDMIEKILILKKNRTMLEKMGRNGRKAIFEKHNWSAIADKTEQFIADLISNHKKYYNFHPSDLLVFLRWGYKKL